MIYTPIVLFLAVVLACFISGCNTVGCMENQSSLPLAGFYDSSTGSAIQLDSIEVKGIGAPGDSLLYVSGTRLTEIYLPFRTTASQTTFCLHYCNRQLSDPSLNDTLKFAYTAMPYFAGEECGAMYRYNVTRVEYTSNLIDSVVLVDSLITNVAVQQIHIYFRTSKAEEGNDR